MRMRGRKLLTICLTLLILLLLCIGYLSNGSKDSSTVDPFIIHLSSDDNNYDIEEQLPAQQLNMAHFATFSNNNNNNNKSHLLNITNFEYLLPNNLCRVYDKELLGVIIITSYAGNDALRAAHRQAIAQSKLAEMGFQRVFLLAALPKSEKFVTQNQLEDEQKRFSDLLQGNFVESYRNLSYKHVMGLHWAASNCRTANFIIKLDDDIIYDVFHLRRYLEALEVKQPKLSSSASLLAGFVLDARPPIRNAANKWFVTKQEYPGAMYPAYLSGWMYITNPATAMRLVKEAKRQSSIFWIDDTWLTGLVRTVLGIPMQRCNEWYSANSQFLDCCVRDLKQMSYECEYFVGPNGGDSKLLVEFLHNVEKCYFDECSKRPADRTLRQTCVASAKNLLPDHGAAQVQQLRLR